MFVFLVACVFVSLFACLLVCFVSLLVWLVGRLIGWLLGWLAGWLAVLLVCPCLWGMFVGRCRIRMCNYCFMYSTRCTRDTAWNGIVQDGTVLYSVVQNGAVLFSAARYGMVRHGVLCYDT